VSLLQEGEARHGHVLVRGVGRSYGDSGLNPGGALLIATELDRLIAFDPVSRRLRAEGGITLAALLRVLVPKGFFLPVVPGTSFVTLAGAVANDVHGKNHKTAGTFGRWVRAIGLVRSDGTEHVLEADDTSGLFSSTIGGLGLTGLIRWVEIEVVPVLGPAIETETHPFATLEEGLDQAGTIGREWTHDVAWVDCNAKGAALGRGLMMLGRHVQGDAQGSVGNARFEVLMDGPGWLLNGVSMSAFNSLYYALGRRKTGKRVVHYAPYFFPLDTVGGWNRLYGRRGFHQHQSVVPHDAARDALREMLGQIASAGDGSFLAVLKAFGDLPSPGMLSYPMPGMTLALDFRNRGERTLSLLARLDAVVREARGRLYPAKDARMDAAMFRAGYPQWEQFARHVDPAFSSGFWRRVAG
jgi:FAD/FMN-containing dehydrogenase